MPDIGKNLTEWTDLFREFLQYLRPYRLIRDFRKRFVEGRIRVFQVYNPNGLMTEWEITGAKRGINCSEDGRLWVDGKNDTPAPGTNTIDIYMDSGLTIPVGQAIGVDGAVVDINEVSNSGLGGSLKLDATFSNCNETLALDIDEGVKGNRAFDTGLGGTYASRKFTDNLNNIASQLASLASTAKSDLETNFIKTRLKEFMSTPTSTVFTSTEDVDDNNDVVITRSGILAELCDDMEDNTVSGAMNIDENTVTSGVPAYDSDNDGSGTLTFVAIRQNAVNGKITITCTAGSDTTLEETFDVKMQATDGRTISGKLSMTIDCEWETQLMGVRLLLSRVITDVDTSNQISGYTVDGETLDNTDAGVIYQELTSGTYDGGSDKRVNWYSDSTKLSLVARGERAGDGAVTMVEQNSSGLSGTCTIAYTADDLAMEVHLNPFSVDDVITVDVSNARDGRIQSLFADIWGIALPSASAPAAIPDAIVKEGLDHIIDAS